MHRDIKPANIFVTKRGHAKILDFGLAKLTAQPKSVPPGIGQTMSTGTTEVPEEQLTSPGTDAGNGGLHVSGAGAGKGTGLRGPTCSLLELCCTKWRREDCRFRGDTSAVIFDAILNRAPTPPVRLNPEVPPKLEEIINKALEKDRELRYQHAAELRADLKRLKREIDSGKSAIAVASVKEAVSPHHRSHCRQCSASPGLSATSVATRRTRPLLRELVLVARQSRYRNCRGRGGGGAGGCRLVLPVAHGRRRDD